MDLNGKGQDCSTIFKPERPVLEPFVDLDQGLYTASAARV
jgi:hypothetical protein